jgi:hypothetical protein
MYPSDLGIFAVTTSIQLIGYMLCRNFFNVKGRAWLLSLGTSAVYTLLTPYVCFQFAYALYQGRDAVLHLYLNESFVDRVFVIWFMSFLLLDCSVGLIDYRSQLRMDTTWMHHAGFLANGLLTIVKKRSSAVVLMAPLEIPTFFLALGSVLPGCRNDFLFGTSFFIFRIVYESTMCIYALTVPEMPRVYIVCVYAATMTMHSFWFYKWYRTYTFAGKKYTQLV